VDYVTSDSYKYTNKFAPAHAINVYCWWTATVKVTSNIGHTHRSVKVNFKPWPSDHLDPLNRPQRRYGRFGDEKNLLPLPAVEHRIIQCIAHSQHRQRCRGSPLHPNLILILYLGLITWFLPLRFSDYIFCAFIVGLKVKKLPVD
jgi:hypothetical protein